MNRAQRRIAVALGSCTLGCGDSPAGPGTDVASVEVTSAIDVVIAQGRTAQLVATARDGAGATVAGVAFTWITSDGSVITVGGTGVATAAAAGNATVTATVTGSTAAGSIPLRVVDADLDAVGLLSGDPYADALIAALSSAARATVQSAWDACGAGAVNGNVLAIAGCATDIRAAAAAATEPTDRAVLAVLTLFGDQIERQLGL